MPSKNYNCVKIELDDSERPHGQPKQVAKSSKNRRKQKKMPIKSSSSRRKQKISTRTEFDQDQKISWLCATCQKVFISRAALKIHETSQTHKKTLLKSNFETILESQNSGESVSEGLDNSLSIDSAVSHFGDDFDTEDTDPLL